MGDRLTVKHNGEPQRAEKIWNFAYSETARRFLPRTREAGKGLPHKLN